MGGGGPRRGIQGLAGLAGRATQPSGRRPSCIGAPRVTAKPQRTDPSLGASVTMSDVARMAGVSESTVSRALSGSPLVSDATRERVGALARQAGYLVNEQASNLARGQTRTIEVMFPIEAGTLQHVSDPFFVDMLAALTDALAGHGYDALLTRSPPWDAERPGCAYLGGRAGGVIFVGQGRHADAIDAFARQHRRVVTWGAVRPEQTACVVGSDNAGGARAATRHLLGLGRRRVAFMGDRTLPEIAQRYAGYAGALAEAGLALDPALVFDAPFDVAGARAAAAPLAGLADRFDGLVAASDMIALAAIAALRDGGVSVPGDVGVVGFDDIALAEHVYPALTTVHQRIKRGGEVMVAEMMTMLEGGEARSHVLPGELVVRRSCGAGARGAGS